MMEWFYQIPGVDELRSAESFFQFFAVPYQPELLGRCCLPVLATFHRKLRAEVPRALAAGAKTARGELSATVSGERNMRPKFTFSEEVRVVRAIRNDGTVAGFAPGALLVRRGSTGFVRDWGVFLQDQIIYQIHFPETDRIIGCREQELIPITQPWLAGNLQYGDSVTCQMALAVNGEVVVAVGQRGRIEATDRGETGDSYTVDFSGRWFRVPARAITLIEEREE